MISALQRNSSWACRLCFALCYGLAAVGRLAAETQTAGLEGIVQDQSGGIVSDATVTLRDEATNQSRTTLTDRQGSYRLTDVPVGTYEVRVDLDGFASFTFGGLVLAIGRTTRLTVTLRPAGVLETIVVGAQPPPLDSRRTSVATTIDTERIEELPVRSRHYLEFVLLAPGVTRSRVETTAGAATSTLPDSGFSFGGLRPRSNTLTIDGLDNNDEFSGSSRTELSLETVREFQVVSNGWSAEHGGAGGSIDVVTKSGANILHGDVFLFAQSGALNAAPKLDTATGDTRPRWSAIAVGWRPVAHSLTAERSITRLQNVSRHTITPHRISVRTRRPPLTRR